MRGKICIVDHDLASRGYLRECLEREGHHVVTLDNGLQVKPYLSEGNFDILILNIETPGVREKNLLLDIKKPADQESFLLSQREVMPSSENSFFFHPVGDGDMVKCYRNLS